MSNNGVWIVNLGADPEPIKLGDKDLYKLRCADKTPGKKSITRWFQAMVGGPDMNTAARLVKGDCIALAGQMTKEEYAPKKPRYKGEKVEVDSMPFAKIMQVVKSETFFNREATGPDVGVESAETVATTTGDFPTDTSAAPELEGL